MKKYIFVQNVFCGEGSFRELMRGLPYNRIAFITGKSSINKCVEYYESIEFLLKNKTKTVEVFSGVPSEPSCKDIDDLVIKVKSIDPQIIIGIGGGSVMDAAKAVSALLTNDGSVADYLEGVGCGKKIVNQTVKLITVPTVAGSGAESTRNCVITDRKAGFKKSFRDDRILAGTVVLDPLLSLSLPVDISVRSGLDCLTQLIESSVSIKSDGFIKSFASAYISNVISSLSVVYSDPSNIKARTDMLISSSVSGTALTNGGLGAVHGLASGIGGFENISHGTLCAVLLPHIVKLNLKYNSGLYNDLSDILKVKPFNFADYLYNLNESLGIPCNFKSFGIDKSKISTYVNKSAGSSMDGNPVKLDYNQLIVLLEELF